MFCSQFYINLDPIPWNNNKIKHYKKFNKKKNFRTRNKNSLRKIPHFPLFFWNGNFVGTRSLHTRKLSEITVSCVVNGGSIDLFHGLFQVVSP